MPIRSVPPQALTFLKSVEGFSLKPYFDRGGKATNGYGHVLDPGHDPHGVINQAQADTWLVADADTAADRLADRVNEHVILGLDDDQYAALISFVFNLGAGEGWQIWDYLNVGNLAQVPAQMLRFDHVEIDGKLVQDKGLMNRRLAEIALWNKVETPVAQLSSGFVRDAQTPPAPPAPKPLATASIFSKVVTVTAAVGAAATQVNAALAGSAVAPLLALIPQAHAITLGLTGLAVASSVLGLVISNLQNAITAK